MAEGDECVVNVAIRDGISEAAQEYEGQGIAVVAHLEARLAIRDDPEALYEAIRTIFRALPRRLPGGSTLYVRTEDRAGGDVELVWEARQAGAGDPEATPAAALREGPEGDLLELALLGLEAICRARATQVGVVEPPGRSVFGPREARFGLRRRFMLLIPGDTRAGLRRWREQD